MPKQEFATAADWETGTLVDLDNNDGILTPSDGEAWGYWLSPVITPDEIEHWVRLVLWANVRECTSAYCFWKSGAAEDLDDWSGDPEAPGDWAGPYDAEDLFGVINVALRTQILAGATAGASLRFVVILEGE